MTIAEGKFYFDVTKWQRQKGHSSGLNRVSSCLQKALKEQLGDRFECVRWSRWRRDFIDTKKGASVGIGSAGDVLFTPEQFALKERFGARNWLKRFRGKSSILYYDSIPFEYPETTWPKSVQRFSSYFQDLSEYKNVMYISSEARESALRVAQKSGWKFVHGETIPLGADHLSDIRIDHSATLSELLSFVSVGILEWRKGQDLLMEASELLWQEGLDFKVEFLGRKNPHFGDKVLRKMDLLQGKGYPVRWHEKASDEVMKNIYRKRVVLVMPSRAEGFGLPVVEGLARGLPVICSNQPCLENEAVRLGVAMIEPLDVKNLAAAMRELLTDEGYQSGLARSQKAQMNLPAWKDSVSSILASVEFS